MLRLSSSTSANIKTEALLLPVFEQDEKESTGDEFRAVRQAFCLKEFSGAKDEQVIFYQPEGFQASRVMLLGMGKRTQAVAETFRAAVGKAVKQCIQMKLENVAMTLPQGPLNGMDISDVAEAIMEGVLLASHRSALFRSKREQGVLKTFHLLTGRGDRRKLKIIADRTFIVCEGTRMAREWVTTPSNRKKPAEFAETLRRKALENGLRVQVLNQKALERKKCGAILAVNSGSVGEARMVILEHKPKENRGKIVLVGKGVTFDSGGLNLKPSNSIETMKMDMAGAAAVAAAVIAASRLKSNMRVIGVIPLVENMASGTAVRPGDIITGYTGKTIEIGNTDAEGRLILSDALAYALDHYKPDLMIDLATLTGACVMALGEKIAGVFSGDDALVHAILTAGAETHERCWRLPLPEDYKELIKSDFADIKNLAKTRQGGAITAALFLSEFVEGARWAHVDIAGPAYSQKPSAYCDAGGTGFGVRLLCRLLEKIESGECPI